MSKGDTYRPVNKSRYDRNYMRAYGRLCPKCEGCGNSVKYPPDGQIGEIVRCPRCDGVGYIPKKVQ